MKALLILSLFFTATAAIADEATLDLSGQNPVIKITSNRSAGTASQLFSVLMDGGATRKLRHLGSTYVGENIETNASSFSSASDRGNITRFYSTKLNLVAGKSEGSINGNEVILKGEIAHELSVFVSTALNLSRTPNENGEVIAKARFINCNEKTNDLTTAICSLEITP